MRTVKFSHGACGDLLNKILSLERLFVKPFLIVGETQNIPQTGRLIMISPSSRPMEEMAVRSHLNVHKILWLSTIDSSGI
jgi:hypothetical protein